MGKYDVGVLMKKNIQLQLVEKATKRNCNTLINLPLVFSLIEEGTHAILAVRKAKYGKQRSVLCGKSGIAYAVGDTPEIKSLILFPQTIIFEHAVFNYVNHIILRIM